MEFFKRKEKKLTLTEEVSMRAAPELLCTTPDWSFDFPGE